MASQSQDTSTSGDISIYADAYKVSPYAQDAMKWAVGNSIIGANGAASELNPQGKTMRAECATIIQRFMEKQTA